jgi:hypothetical protein
MEKITAAYYRRGGFYSGRPCILQTCARGESDGAIRRAFVEGHGPEFVPVPRQARGVPAVV